MNRRPNETLHQYDLLPSSYRIRNRVRLLSRSWSAVVMILTAVFIAATAASLLHVHRQNQLHTEIACAALPLRQLRQEATQLRLRNEQRDRWCQLVESAKPDDSALQTIAAIALASQNGNRQILIDAVHLRFEVESAVTEASAGPWTSPTLDIAARATSAAAQQGWFDRLVQLERIDRLTFEGASEDEQSAVRLVQDGMLHLQLTGTPLATRVMP